MKEAGDLERRRPPGTANRRSCRFAQWLRVQTYAATARTCSSVIAVPPFGGIGTPELDSCADTPFRMFWTIDSYEPSM
jgi:hypothetical protein